MCKLRSIFSQRVISSPLQKRIARSMKIMGLHVVKEEKNTVKQADKSNVWGCVHENDILSNCLKTKATRRVRSVGKRGLCGGPARRVQAAQWNSGWGRPSLRERWRCSMSWVCFYTWQNKRLRCVSLVSLNCRETVSWSPELPNRPDKSVRKHDRAA